MHGVVLPFSFLYEAKLPKRSQIVEDTLSDAESGFYMLGVQKFCKDAPSPNFLLILLLINAFHISVSIFEFSRSCLIIKERNE